MSKGIKWLICGIMVFALALTAVLALRSRDMRTGLAQKETELAGSRAVWEKIAEEKETLLDELETAEDDLREAQLSLSEATQRAEELTAENDTLRAEIAALEAGGTPPDSGE